MKLVIALCLLVLSASTAWGQGCSTVVTSSVNPPVGSVYTYCGPTIGAQWTVIPSSPVSGTGSSIVGDFVCWGNNTATSLISCGRVSAPVTIPISTPSTSTSTGALVVAGGVGIGSNLNVGGTLDVDGLLNVTGNVVFGTGLGVIGNVAVGVDLSVGRNASIAGELTVGSDLAGGIFGAYKILAGAININTIVGETENNAPYGTPIFPAGVVGYGKLVANGNQAFGMYGESAAYQTGGGVVVGGEFTVHNYTGIAADIGLPPATALGTFKTTLIGENITCGAVNSETGDCSVGLNVANNSGTTTGPVFNTGIYVWAYRAIGIAVNAMPSGTQTGVQIETNGQGSGIVIKSLAEPNPSFGAFQFYDHTGLGLFSVLYNGALSFNTLLATATATAGAAGATPATPAGYLQVWVGSTPYKVPYYNP